MVTLALYWTNKDVGPSHLLAKRFLKRKKERIAIPCERGVSEALARILIAITYVWLIFIPECFAASKDAWRTPSSVTFIQVFFTRFLVQKLWCNLHQWKERSSASTTWQKQTWHRTRWPSITSKEPTSTSGTQQLSPPGRNSYLHIHCFNRSTSRRHHMRQTEPGEFYRTWTHTHCAILLVHMSEDCSSSSLL